MKTLNLITFIATASVLLAATACKKNNTENTNTLTAETFNEKYSVPAQVFSGNASATFTITGTKGTKINFPANAFLDENGHTVAGDVKVILKEVLSKRDIIFSGKMTESNGQLLVSGGEIEIKAWQNGKALKPNPATAIQVKVPTVMNGGDMGLFVQAPSSIASDSTWTQIRKEIQKTSDYYVFDLPGFGWVNCDYFYSDPRPKTTITVKPTSFSNLNIKSQKVYLIFDDKNTVIYLPFSIPLNRFQSYINSMPIGQTAKLVVISVDVNNTVYFGHTSITVSADLNTDVPITAATQADLDAYLSTLN